MTFPPTDLVTISTRFPKVAFAQLKSQEFPAPTVFKGHLPDESDAKTYVRAETGMKLTCGFEMLLSDSQHQDKPAVREMKLVLEDVQSGDENLPSDSEI